MNSAPQVRSQSAKPAVNVKQQLRPIQSALPTKNLQVKPQNLLTFEKLLDDNNPNQTTTTQTRPQTGVTRNITSAKTSKSIATGMTFCYLKKGSDLIEIQPKEVIFTDIQPFQKQETYIVIRNLTKHPRRIRIQQPRSTKFRVDFDMQKGIAAGLAIKVLVSFEPQEAISSDCHDTLIVLSEEGFRQEVQLSALKSQPALEFQEFIDFGYVKTGTEAKRDCIFRNNGHADGKVNIKFDQMQQIRVQPNLFTLKPSEQCSISIIYNKNRAIDVGTYRGTLDVLIDGELQSKKIDLAATSVDYNRFFMDEHGSQSTLIDFGELYVGKSKVYRGTYVNNTPVGINYNILTKQGYHSVQEETINLQTPNELGIEQTEKLISIKPSHGYIVPFSKVELTIICKGQVSIKNQMQAKSYCFSGERQAPPGMIQDFAYSLIFESETQEPDENVVVHISGKQVVPMIKLARQMLNFGECDVNDNKDILVQVENVHPFLPIEISLAKVSCFFFKPEKLMIPPQAGTPLQASFRPINVGKYNTTVDLLLIEGLLKIPIKVSGESNKIARKRPQTRGPEANPNDFEVDPKFIDQDKLEYIKKRKIELLEMHQGTKVQKAAIEHMVSGYFMDSQKTTHFERQISDQKINQFKEEKQNKQKYNNFLVEKRNNRLEQKRQQILSARVNEIQKRVQSTDQQFDATDQQNKDPKLSAPVDYEFEFGLNEQLINEPDLPLPQSKEGLFVIKPIEQYEPLKKQEGEKVVFNADPTQPVKRILSGRPQSHKQVRDVNLTLTPEELKKIQAGPVKIDFGNIYINCLMSRTFYVKNELRNAIQCRVIPDREEVKDTYSQPQIIESAQTAQFEICLKPQGLGQFKHNIKYIINERHNFEMMITANVDSVTVDVSKTSIKFSFPDDSLAMSVTETIKLINNGVGTASYKWILNEQSKLFNINQKEGKVPPQSTIDVQITYTPSNIMKDPEDPASDQVFNSLKVRDSMTRYDEEKIILKVIDGLDQQIKCVGIVNDPRCILLNPNVDIGEFPVCRQAKGVFSIKNTSRISGVYKLLSDKFPYQCDVVPVGGRIGTDEKKDFTIKIESNQERIVNQEIYIMFRSGRVLRLPFQIKIIVPLITIIEKEFNFGHVTTLGNQGSLPMTIANQSNVEGEIIFDLRSEELNPDASDGVQCLEICQIDSTEKSLLKSVMDEKFEDERQRTQITSHEDETKMQHETKMNKKFFMKVDPQQTLHFELRIFPKEIKRYHFLLPVQLNKYGRISGLDRMVTCIGSKPRFLVDPQQVEFGRKIILSPPEKNSAIMREVLLSNPEYKSISFKIDDSPIKNEKVFQVVPLVGRVDGGQTLSLKVMFNPRYSGEYETSLPLYLDDQAYNNKPYLDLVIKGTAAEPRLLYDRREVILPPVPLNIESKTIFRLINDGFENIKIQAKPIEGFLIEFPEGNTLGVTKPSIQLLAKFSSPKPLSITQILEIYDESQRVYQITVSATADNCTFTNYPYLCSHEGRYRINLQTGGELMKQPLILIELPPEESDEEDLTTSNNRISTRKTQQPLPTHVSFQEEGVTKEAIAASHPCMSISELKSKCDHIRRWMNYFVLNVPIEKFPDSIIEQNGSQIYDLVQFLANKQQMPAKVSIIDHKQRFERISNLVVQWKELILMLKMEGALLNHIRPYYLLNYQDYGYYVTNIEKEYANSIHPQFIKLSQSKFERMQLESYLVLVYQILKLYYLPRVTLKAMKQICPVFQASESYIMQSNVYGQQETLLMRWIETQLDIYWTGTPLQTNCPHRLQQMNTSLRDCQHLAVLALSYIGSAALKYFNPLGQPRKVIQNEQQIETNISILFKGFNDTGIQTHFNLDDYKQMSNPETLLLLMTLFNTLPNYIPKPQPIIFSCTLGSHVVKTIELTNPTNKTVAYWVKLDGSTDFALDDDDNFRIEPKQTIKYKVKFLSRVSEEQVGRITFVNKRESNVIVGALVFELKSEIVGRVSEKVWTVQSVLYEQKEFSIQVVNKFNTSEFGHFMIQIVPIKLLPPKPWEDPNQQKKKKKTALSQMDKKKEQDREQKEKERWEKLEKEEPFPVFFCKQDSIRLKRGGVYNLNMQFIPLSLTQHKCYVIFQDSQVGEFQYEIVGTVEPPDILIDIRVNQQVFIDQLSTYVHHIPLNNPPLRQARRLVEQLLIDRKRLSAQMLNKQHSNKSLTIPPKNQIPGELQDETIFNVIQEDTSTPNYVTTEKFFILKNYKKLKKNQQQQQQLQPSQAVQQQLPTQPANEENHYTEEDDELKLTDEVEEEKYQSEYDQNQMNFSFNFKSAIKDYITYFSLMNETKTDVRRIRLCVTSLPKPVKATIEMISPSREVLVQDIPIMNPTERDFYIKATLTGEESKNYQYFSIVQQSLQNTNNQTQSSKQDANQLLQLKKQNNKDHIIKKKSNGAISIMFAPKGICSAEAKLTLYNPLTNDLFEYDLKGIGEEPLSEGHITLSCLARQTTRHNIVLHNHTDQPITYSIETDLMNASGEPQITLPPQSSLPYMFIVTPMLSGTYMGSITFTEVNEELPVDKRVYLWYTITLNTESPRCEQVVDLVSPVRKAIAFDIELANPLSEDVTFEVIVNGEGLQGDPWFPVLSGTQSTYQLIFQPLKEGKEKGTVAFIHPKLGEIWYELNLIGEDRGGLRLPQFKTELGKVDQQEVMLENPTGKAVNFSVDISNTANFALNFNGEYVLPPYSQTAAYISFTPSSLTSHSGDIIIKTEEIGKWIFLCFGTGEPPTPYPEKILICKLGGSLTGQVEWKNPLKDQLNLQLFLEYDDVEGTDQAFLLIAKKVNNRVVVPAQSIIQIAYHFSPKEIRSYRVSINLVMNEKIKWTFPFVGHTESAANNLVNNIQTKCRIPFNQKMNLTLPGLSSANQKDEFSFELQDQSEFSKLVKRWLQIGLKKKYLEKVEEPLVFDVLFKPMKPFKCMVELLVKRQSGGIWKFKLGLHALEPDPDDTIVIESPLNKISYVSFKLTNRHEEFTPFQAYFGVDSNPEFSVEPKTGLLEPYGKKGTEFKIGFKPREYGKRKEGKLIIQTELMHWSYILRGYLPKYIPPGDKNSIIDDQLQSELRRKLKHKQPGDVNFVIENLKIPRVSPPRQKSNSPEQLSPQQSQMQLKTTKRSIKK